jgi:hypothetical protein
MELRAGTDLSTTAVSEKVGIDRSATLLHHTPPMPRSVESTDIASVNPPPSKPQPLYLRMYFRPHLVEVVRMVGYEGVPLAEAQKKTKEFREKYGEKMKEAEELVTIDASKEPHWVRLTDEVRKFAYQLLGPPPEAKPQPAPSPPGAELASTPSAPRRPERQKRAEKNPAVQTSAVNENPEKSQKTKAVFYPEAPRGRAVFHPRNSMLPKYQEWLDQTGQAYLTLEEARKGMDTVKDLRTLDFIVMGEDQNLLVTVRRNLTTRQKGDMAAWQELFGNRYRAVRAWQFTDGLHWDWQYVPLEDSP